MRPLSLTRLKRLRGSGKSTLATQLEGLYPAHYVRVNQDSLGNRQKCEALTQRALREVSCCLL